MNYNKWITFLPKDFKKCIITTFDDGYQNYKYKYDNNWLVIATNNKGKYMLKNKIQPEIKINSISSWKVKLIN